MANVIMIIKEVLQYEFMWKALLVGTLIAVSCSFLGIFLVLKKHAMIGDGLAHVSFATVAIALFFQASPLLVSIPLVVIASFLILKLTEKADLHGDAAIGLVSSLAIAIGVLIASLAQGFNVDLFSYLFGSILVISDLEVILSIGLAVLVIGTILFFYNSLFAITYDEEFARVSGLDTKRFNYLIAILTSITIVLGIRVVGTMLVSSLIIFPTVTALQFAKGFKTTIFGAVSIAIFCVLFGVFLSYLINLPTGATIVLMNGICFVIAFGIKKIRLA